MYRLLHIILLFCSLPFFSSTAQTMGQKWEGEGTQRSPYLIKSEVDLQILAQEVNQGTDYKGYFFKLANDINLSTVCGENLSDWSSIGSIENYFEGDFNGDGHTVSNIYIQTRGARTSYRGLFGYVGPYGKISNLIVQGSIYASFWAGAIAGASSGVISNCSNEGCDVESWQYAGGIVGGNFGVVSQCRNEATIRSYLATGGICGYNYGGLYKSYNYGEIYGYTGSGGLVGYNGGFSSFSNCYNRPMGIVQNCANNSFVSGKEKVGGIVGRNDGLFFNNYNRGELSAEKEVGGLVGYNGGFDGVEGLIYNSYNIGNVLCSVSQGGGAIGVNEFSGNIYNIYTSGVVYVPGTSVSILSSNEGNLNHCYAMGQNLTLVNSNNGIMTDCSIIHPDSFQVLTDNLNAWVDEAQDSIFSHWACLGDSKYPYFANLSSPIYNVLVYNFHGIIEENLLAFSEGKEVKLNVTPDPGYTLSGATAICNMDSVPITVENNQLSFVMPSGDVFIYLEWQEDQITRVNNLKVIGGFSELFLYSKENMVVDIYSIDGRHITNFSISSMEEKRIPIPSGVYLINGIELIVR